MATFVFEKEIKKIFFATKHKLARSLDNRQVCIIYYYKSIFIIHTYKFYYTALTLLVHLNILKYIRERFCVKNKIETSHVINRDHIWQKVNVFLIAQQVENCWQ